MKPRYNKRKHPSVIFLYEDRDSITGEREYTARKDRYAGSEIHMGAFDWIGAGSMCKTWKSEKAARLWLGKHYEQYKVLLVLDWTPDRLVPQEPLT